MSELKLTFREKVWEVTRRIPKGKVATYGQIAALVGSPKGARAVGMCMQTNPSIENAPCHRVVASNGKLTGYAFGGTNVKKTILLKEGVEFVGDKVDLKQSLWDEN